MAKRVTSSLPGLSARQRLLDKAAAEHFVAAIEDARLSGRDGRAALNKPHFRAISAGKLDRRRNPRIAIADLHLGLELVIKPLRTNQTHLLRDQSGRAETAASADRNVAAGSVDRAHVKRFARGDTEAAPLSHSKVVDAGVAGERPPGIIDNPAGPDSVGGRGALDVSGIVAVGHEADLLALGLIGINQPERSRARTGLVLGHRPKREQGPGQLALLQAEEKIGLIFSLIGRSTQPKDSVGAGCDPRVMAGRDEVRLKGARALPQAIELDLAIAHHARIRRAAAQVLGSKVVHHTGSEIRSQIDDVKGKIEPLRYPARVLEIVVRTTGPSAARFARRPLGRKPHRHPDDIVALVAEQRRGHGTIDSAGHRNQHPRLHRAAPTVVAADSAELTGSAATTRRQTSGINSPARAISAAVVLQPRLMRKELRAAAGSRPIASSTWEGSTAPAAQAEPIDTSTPSRSSAINIVSPSTYGKVRLRVFWMRSRRGPFRRSPGIARSSRSSNWADNAPTRIDSSSRAPITVSAATPKPIAPARFGVPARSPVSCGPPSMTGARALPGRTYSAPLPPGPPSLWALSAIRSQPKSSTASGIRPATCAASRCRSAPARLAASVTGAIVWIAPTSALASPSVTRAVSAPTCRVIASGLTRPSESGATRTISNPALSSAVKGASIDECSIAVVTICRRADKRAAPKIARLLASVPPLVKTIDRVGAPSSRATRSRARSSSRRARWPLR